MSVLRSSVVVLFASVVAVAAAQQKESTSVAPAQSSEIDRYIHDSWSALRRSMDDCVSLVDPKVKATPVLYLPKDFPEPPEVAALTAHCGVLVERLPAVIQGREQMPAIRTPGLLYLPHSYVVPGGRFNEMYGWDSYFILLGLVRDGHLGLARGMVENFFFEIEHYGGVLNANRTYYFTRSQPPLLSSMIRTVYDAETAAGNRMRARAWLSRAYSFAKRDHALWLRPEHRAGSTGLARYYDYGEGPVPEMGDDPSYYQTVLTWLLAHPEAHADYLVEGPAQPAAVDRASLAAVSCDPAQSAVCAQAHIDEHWLSRAFYKSDRAMRESGFDTTFRWGPFGGSTDHYAPTDLNALLYKYERDLAWMAQQLGKKDQARHWEATAGARRASINRYLWNPQRGMYFDYDFVARKASTYVFLTMFYPLWANAASTEQAQRVEANLPLFEKPGGLAMSTTNSGEQWDLPYGWAPSTWLAVDAMMRYGDKQDALRVSHAFKTTVRDNFTCDHTVREKYNVATRSSVVSVNAGYSENVVGFGWTNAVYLKLEDMLTRAGEVESPLPPANYCQTRNTAGLSRISVGTRLLVDNNER